MNVCGYYQRQRPMQEQQIKQFKSRLQIADEYASEMAELFQVNKEDILKMSRGSPRHCAARFCLYEKLRQRKWSYPLIGQTLNRDHQSIFNGIRRIRDARTNPNNTYYTYLKEVGL